METPEHRPSPTSQYVRIMEAPKQSTYAPLEVLHPELVGWEPVHPKALRIEIGSQVLDVRCEDQNEPGGDTSGRLFKELLINCVPPGKQPEVRKFSFKRAMGPGDWLDYRKLEKADASLPKHAATAERLAQTLGTLGDTPGGLDFLKGQFATRLGLHNSRQGGFAEAQLRALRGKASPTLTASEQGINKRLIFLDIQQNRLDQALSELPDGDAWRAELAMLIADAYALGRVQREAELAPLVDPVLRKARATAVKKKGVGELGGKTTSLKAYADWKFPFRFGFVEPAIFEYCDEFGYTDLKVDELKKDLTATLGEIFKQCRDHV